MAEILLCKNGKCTKTVPPSKNPGVPRVFCSLRCKSAFHTRARYAREAGNPAVDGIRRDPAGAEYISRQICETARAAQHRYEKHLKACSLAEDGRCPGARDLYGMARLCLIQAVLAEDWHTLRRREAGQVYDRVSTTETGYWK